MRIRKQTDILQTEEINLIAAASDALAHPARIEIFRYIYSENLKGNLKICTKDLVEKFGYSQATISQHMKKLLISGLVEGKKQGSYNYYMVNLGMLGKYLDAVKKLK